jgi:hypothetical protein
MRMDKTDTPGFAGRICFDNTSKKIIFGGLLYHQFPYTIRFSLSDKIYACR